MCDRCLERSRQFSSERDLKKAFFLKRPEILKTRTEKDITKSATEIAKECYDKFLKHCHHPKRDHVDVGCGSILQNERNTSRKSQHKNFKHFVQGNRTKDLVALALAELLVYEMILELREGNPINIWNARG